MNEPASHLKPPLLTVSQLTQAIKLSLESTFATVSLQGEVSNFKLQTSGHLYFSLKDSQAQIAAVMFKADASGLRVMPKAGDQVIVKGELTVYPPKGNYQLLVRELSYVGLGELLLKLEELKIKLHQKGWFKASHKKPIPKFPRRIGVVTSPTGAVIQDILNVLTRRFSGFHLILNPVKVQGEGAAQEIAQAIEQFNRHQLVDVMIVGRGGGSLEDLWAFNEEIVADAIYHSHIPIISAVGHETDHCIADYVADVRAPTPSAAAEIVIAEKHQQLQNLQQWQRRLQQTLLHLIQKNRYRLEGLLKQPKIAQPRLILESPMQRLDDCRSDIEEAMQKYLHQLHHRLAIRSQQLIGLKPSSQLATFKQQLLHWRQAIDQHLSRHVAHRQHGLAQKQSLLQQKWSQQMHRYARCFQADQKHLQLDRHMRECMHAKQDQLNHVISMLKALDPKNLLSKGYSILLAEKEGHIINSVRMLQRHQQAKVLLADGEALITINETRLCE